MVFPLFYIKNFKSARTTPASQQQQQPQQQQQKVIHQCHPEKSSPPTPAKYSNYILFFKLFDIQKYLYLRKNKNKDIWPILNYYFLFLFPFPFSFLTFSLLFSFSPIHHSLFFTALEFLKKFLLYISAEGTRI